MEGGKTPEAIHTWLIMLKALQAISRFALPPILKEGLGESDFRALEVLLHKGPMPVNAIGPKVDLNPGSCQRSNRSTVQEGVGQSCGERERSPRSHCFAYGEGTPSIRSDLPPTRRSHQTCISGCLARGAAPDGRSAQENRKTRRRIGRTRGPPLGSCL
jgi:hypothetical protein